MGEHIKLWAGQSFDGGGSHFCRAECVIRIMNDTSNDRTDERRWEAMPRIAAGTELQDSLLTDFAVEVL